MATGRSNEGEVDRGSMTNIYDGTFHEPILGTKNVHKTYIYNQVPGRQQPVQDESSEVIHLSSSIRMFKNKPLFYNGNIFEGEVLSSVVGNKPIAVKLIRHTEQNIQEAITLSKLSSHRNVVSVVHSDLCKQGAFTYIYIAMELCHKQNLNEHVIEQKNRNVAFEPELSISRVKQLVTGLQFIHRNKVIHRDFKPHNVLFSLDKSTLKIADFGISKPMTSGRTMTKVTGTSMGTDGYRAPETYNKNEISQHADIYSLGLVIYFILSRGSHAFGDDPDDWNSNIKKNRNRDLSELLVPRARSLIEKMLEFVPRNRPTAEQILRNEFFEQEKQELSDAFSAALQLTTTALKTDSIIIQSTSSYKELILFDWNAMNLLSFDPVDNSVTSKKPLFGEMKRKYFTTVALDQVIYVIMEDQSIYSHDYSDNNAKWIEVASTNADHGPWPRAVAHEGFLYVIGASGSIYGSGSDPSDIVERYNPENNTWRNCTKLLRALCDHTVVAAGGHIYVIGGLNNEGNTVDIVTRFDGYRWKDVARLKEPRYWAHAAELSGRIYVIGGLKAVGSRLFSIECIGFSDKSTAVTVHPMRYIRGAGAVQGKIHVVGGTEGNGFPVLGTFDPAAMKFTIVKTLKDMEIQPWTAVAV